MSSSRPPASASKPEQAAETAVVETTATVEDLSLKQKAGDAANRWMARNRSLVLRQTPVWAQSLAAILIGLSTTAVIGGILFRIDEVVTVQGQLKSIGGTVEVKTLEQGKVATEVRKLLIQMLPAGKTDQDSVAGRLYRSTCTHFFPNALKNEHIRVHCHANGQHQTGNAWEGEHATQ